VPSWAKGPNVGNKLINVRAESVTDKPTFTRLLASTRCILPADGFHARQDLGPDQDAPDAGRVGGEGASSPWTSPPGTAPLPALAGLWTTNHHADPADPVTSCRILTTSAN
jgi:putative SOS response-associated peptidase YedK